eukprot:2527744-Rhodomonas_salina.2
MSRERMLLGWMMSVRSPLLVEGIGGYGISSCQGHRCVLHGSVRRLQWFRPSSGVFLPCGKRILRTMQIEFVDT